MLDGEETVEIACGELRREGPRQHAGRRGNNVNSLQELRWEKRYSMLDGEETVETAWESFAGRERDSMLDEDKTVEIACGELR